MYKHPAVVTHISRLAQQITSRALRFNACMVHSCVSRCPNRWLVKWTVTSRWVVWQGLYLETPRIPTKPGPRVCYDSVFLAVVSVQTVPSPLLLAQTGQCFEHTSASTLRHSVLRAIHWASVARNQA